MARRVFVSFKYDEIEWQNNALRFFQGYGGTAQGTPVYLSPDDIKPTKADIMAAIRERMQGCSGLLVVVGNQAKASPWMVREIECANQMGLPVRWTRHPQASGPVPNSLTSDRELKWTHEAVAGWVSGLPTL